MLARRCDSTQEVRSIISYYELLLYFLSGFWVKSSDFSLLCFHQFLASSSPLFSVDGFSGFLAYLVRLAQSCALLFHCYFSIYSCLRENFGFWIHQSQNYTNPPNIICRVAKDLFVFFPFLSSWGQFRQTRLFSFWLYLISLSPTFPLSLVCTVFLSFILRSQLICFLIEHKL